MQAAPRPTSISTAPWVRAKRQCRETEEAGMQNVVTAALDVLPTGGGVGAEVKDLDLRRIDAATFAAINRAWIEHQVLLFRGQSLTDDDLIAFSRRFGALDSA